MTANYYYNHKNDGLCLTFPGLEWLGYDSKYLKVACHRGSAAWPFIAHPEDGRKKLLPWASLTPKRRGEISERLRKRMGCQHPDSEGCLCGNLIYHTSLEPIRALLVRDDKAEAFFTAYRYTDTTGLECSLPPEKIKHYTNEASLLNLVKEAGDETKAIVKDKLGFKNVADFWDKLIEIIKAEKAAGNVGGKFATSYVRLISANNSALKTYRANGYAALIHGNYGRKNAAKVTEKVAEDKLLKLIEDPRQLDDVFVSMLYSTWASASGYKTISPGTVRNYRISRGYQTDLGRYGVMAYNEKRIREVKGLKPRGPLYLVEHDDNNLDFLYTDGKYQYNRYVAIIVADCFNGLILGKSYRLGDTPEQWQVQQAYIDAMYYIRSLTGGWHLPFEIKSDNWAVKSLTPLYNKIAKLIPAGRGNKHRGYIEQLFGSPHFKRCQKLVGVGNYNGNNLTAKYPGINPDMLLQSLRDKSRPRIGNEAETQIEQFLRLTQKLPAFTRENINAPSKEAQWLEAFNALPADDKRPITDEQFLMKFGIIHSPKHTDSLLVTNRGVEPTISKTKYSYDLPQEWMYQRYIGAKVQVVYDPYDMSRVLITNNDDIRFIATAARLQPRALHDAGTGSRTFLNAILAEKKEQWNEAYSARESRQQVANGYPAAEAILKSGVFKKEIMKGAERAAIEAPGSTETDWDAQQQFINENYDLDKFFNK